MKEILYKSLLLLAPFVLISLFTLIIDPYNLFHISSIIPDDIKIKCLDRNNNITTRAHTTWKTLKFWNYPTPNIVLGDSRIAFLDETLLEAILGKEVSNLAIPSGNLNTVCDLFWLASDKIKLDNVIIQINFNRYDASVNFDFLSPVRELINKPYKYFFNANYLKDSFAVFFSTLKKNSLSIDSPQLIIDNWESSEYILMHDYKFPNYTYPDKYYNELKRIALFCETENISVLFVIAPNYFIVHQYVRRYNLEDEYNRFKDDIRSLGHTIDLDSGLSLSHNKEMYADHFHIQPYLADTLISLIFP